MSFLKKEVHFGKSDQPKEKITWKGFLVDLFNYSAWGALVFAYINFLYNPQPYYSLNLIWDFLFVRSGGPILFQNHVSSELIILGVTTYFMLKQPSHAAKYMIVILSTVALHEFILEIIMLPVTHFYFFLNTRWLFWLSSILVLAIWLSDRPQKKIIGKLALIILAYMVFWAFCIAYFGIGYETVIFFAPGPLYFNPVNNLFEIVSWLIPMGLWIVWRKDAEI